MKKENTIDKVKDIISTIELNDDSNGFNYFDKDFINDDDYSLIKEKMDNLIVLMEKYKFDNKLDILMNMDFETEIWNII